MPKIFEKTVVPQETFAKEVAENLDFMKDLLVEKNRMYGGASMDMGITGVYVHIHDKVTRLRSLIEKRAAGEGVSFEGIEDTLRDLIGYATIGLIVEHQRLLGVPSAGIAVGGSGAGAPFGFDPKKDA